jgi:hypothetical protein
MSMSTFQRYLKAGWQEDESLCNDITTSEVKEERLCAKDFFAISSKNILLIR